MDRLDGITFAFRFQDTLDAVGRGFDINTTPEGTPDYIADGAATILVIRDGVAKRRIVLNAAYGAAHIGEEQQDAERAQHLLVAGLVQACTLSRIEQALPGFLLEPVMANDHDGVLHCAVRKAPQAYRCARVSAEFGADELVEQEFTRYMIQYFDGAFATLETAKDGHSANRDFPKLFKTAHSMASEMLTSAARLIGHRRGMGALEPLFLTNQKLARWQRRDSLPVGCMCFQKTFGAFGSRRHGRVPTSMVSTPT